MRTEFEILTDIDRLYTELSPENISWDGMRSPSQVRAAARKIHQKLKKLFKELGREVDEYQTMEELRALRGKRSAKQTMRRSASGIISDLETRIARLEKQSASRMTPKHFLEMMERKHEDYFLGLDLTNRYTKQLLNFAKERMVKGSEKDKERFILNIAALSRYLKQEAMSMDLVDAIGEIAFYMGKNPFRTEKLSQLEYTWKVGLTDRDTLLDEYQAGKASKEEY